MYLHRRKATRVELQFLDEAFLSALPRIVPSKNNVEIRMDMRKRQMVSRPNGAPPEYSWLDLRSRTVVEVTSEENGYPIEAALQEDTTRGWRATIPGTQIIRLIFDEPQKL
jgi:hypothetical protein